MSLTMNERLLIRSRVSHAGQGLVTVDLLHNTTYGSSVYYSTAVDAHLFFFPLRFISARTRRGRRQRLLSFDLGNLPLVLAVVATSSLRTVRSQQDSYPSPGDTPGVPVDDAFPQWTNEFLSFSKNRNVLVQCHGETSSNRTPSGSTVTVRQPVDPLVIHHRSQSFNAKILRSNLIVQWRPITDFVCKFDPITGVIAAFPNDVRFLTTNEQDELV